MQTVIKNYFDDETLEHIGTRYFIDNEEVNFEDYRDFVADIFNENSNEELNDCVCSQDENCENCNCSECSGCDNVECCNENRDCEDEVLEEICECPVCAAEREVQELDCFCEECVEDNMKDFIDECLEHVFGGCPDCAIESVVKLAFKCLNLGKENVKHEMTEFLDS